MLTEKSRGCTDRVRRVLNNEIPRPNVQNERQKEKGPDLCKEWRQAACVLNIFWGRPYLSMSPFSRFVRLDHTCLCLSVKMFGSLHNAEAVTEASDKGMMRETLGPWSYTMSTVGGDA